MARLNGIILLFAISTFAFFACNNAFVNGEDSQNTESKEINGNGEKENGDEKWELVWSDEFEYKGLPDPQKWSYDTAGNSWDWGNNELQYYTAGRTENARVDGEYLHITARKEERGGKNYTSARLVTREKGDWKYAKVEVRAKLPSGTGTWPAIWMLPTDWVYGDWPKSGEIDIMEHVGYEPDSIYASVHTEKFNHSIGTNITTGIAVPDCEEAFHVYRLEWEKDQIRVYVDDQHYFTFDNEDYSYKGWPFDKRFHLLLNVAVGGDWGGLEGVDESIFPQKMVVDYVRVYQK